MRCGTGSARRPGRTDRGAGLEHVPSTRERVLDGIGRQHRCASRSPAPSTTSRRFGGHRRSGRHRWIDDRRGRIGRARRRRARPRARTPRRARRGDARRPATQPRSRACSGRRRHGLRRPLRGRPDATAATASRSSPKVTDREERRASRPPSSAIGPSRSRLRSRPTRPARCSSAGGSTTTRSSRSSSATRTADVHDVALGLERYWLFEVPGDRARRRAEQRSGDRRRRGRRPRRGHAGRARRCATRTR